MFKVKNKNTCHKNTLNPKMTPELFQDVTQWQKNISEAKLEWKIIIFDRC